MGNHIMSKMKHNKEIENIKNKSNSKNNNNQTKPQFFFSSNDLICNISDNKTDQSNFEESSNSKRKIVSDGKFFCF